VTVDNGGLKKNPGCRPEKTVSNPKEEKKGVKKKDWVDKSLSVPLSGLNGRGGPSLVQKGGGQKTGGEEKKPCQGGGEACGTTGRILVHERCGVESNGRKDCKGKASDNKVLISRQTQAKGQCGNIRKEEKKK